MIILSTRLSKPLVGKGYLKRQRLIDVMERDSYKFLLLVVAAGGYGKSVATIQWLNTKELDHCWLSLDDDCNDLRVFLSYLVASIRFELPSVVPKLVALTEAVELPNASHLSKIFLNELNTIEEELILVLDNYHKVKHPDVHTFMNGILQNFPQQHKTVIISRFDPPLNLKRLFAYDQVNEIRIKDLRFSMEEIVALSADAFSMSVKEEMVTYIQKITEGWIVPIRLMLKDLSRQDEIGVNFPRYHTSSKQLAYNLLEELLDDQPSSVKWGLMVASLFKHFSIDLLIHVAEKEQDQKMDDHARFEELLRQCIDQFLFIYALDNQKQWFRFHHFVQDFLYFKLSRSHSKKQIREMLICGSMYFESKGALNEAIELNVRVKGHSYATLAFTDHQRNVLKKQGMDILLQWLNPLPKPIVEKDLPPINTLTSYLTSNNRLAVQYGSISKKEYEILRLIAQGYQNKEIAEELYYSLGTVKTYIYKIYQKMGAKNRTHAVHIFEELNRRLFRT